MTEEAIIPASLAAALHDYLITRPMCEVERLVLALRQARLYSPEEVEDKE